MKLKYNLKVNYITSSSIFHSVVIVLYATIYLAIIVHIVVQSPCNVLVCFKYFLL
jgi:hypothetical protein